MVKEKKDVGEAYKVPFAVALRALMEEKPKTSQGKLAEITGKTRQTISQYVNGISEPGYDTLVKIADYFEVSVDYLLGRTRDRRTGGTVYDEIDLSEKSLTALLLASAAREDKSKLKEFADLYYGPHWDEERDPTLYAPGEIESVERYRARARLLCDVLPAMTEMIICAALEQGFESLPISFAQLAYPKLYPCPEKDAMDGYQFLDFKNYQITKAIGEWIDFHFHTQDDEE